MADIIGSGINITAYNNLTDVQIQQGVDQIQKHHKNDDLHVTGLGCIETNYVYEKRPQVRIDGEKYYCSLIVMLHTNRIKYGNYNLQHGFDTSHYWCHNPHCVNPSHMHLEDHRVNKSRLYCRIYGTYNGFTCLHLPKCNVCDQTKIKL